MRICGGSPYVRDAFLTGPAKILGVGNGDPNCLEGDKGPERSLFNGLAQLIVQSDKRGGPILVEAAELSPYAAPLMPTSLALRARAATPRRSVPLART